MIQQDDVIQYLSDLELAVVHDICKLLNTCQYPTEDLQSIHSTLKHTHDDYIQMSSVKTYSPHVLNYCKRMFA